jgi:hypothetical protein
MRSESQKCREIRALIAADVHDPEWLERSAAYLGAEPSSLISPVVLLVIWRREWGFHRPYVHNEVPSLIWSRTDGGPRVIDATDDAYATKVIRFALYAKLIEELRAVDLISYVAAGVPDEWRRCKTFRNGEEVDRLIWADALLGQCCVLNPRGRPSTPGALPSIMLSGNVTIELGNQDLGFF